jgi:hypothetical protein
MPLVDVTSTLSGSSFISKAPKSTEDADEKKRAAHTQIPDFVKCATASPLYASLRP